MHAVALQYRELAAVMHEIADLLLGETPIPAIGERSAEVREVVRNSWHGADMVADHRVIAVRPASTGISAATRRSLWQLTTRPPRIRSGSQLPVETGVSIFVRAGRTASGRQDAQVAGL